MVSWSLLHALPYALPQPVTGLATALGALWCLSTIRHYISILWLFVRPSCIRRYLQTRDGRTAWALITGGNGGIGHQLAHQLATMGFNVILHGRNQSKLDAVKADLVRKHPQREFRTIVIDASLASAKEASTYLVPIQDVNLTVLINNAGGVTDSTIGSLDKLPSEKLYTDIAVNAIFPTLLTQQAIPLLEREPAGLIVNVGSLADLGIPMSGSYAGAKGYLTKMTEGLGREMQFLGRNIEVLGVKVGKVWGTGQTVTEAQDFFSPDASGMARAIIDKVGCGRRVVVGHWKHMLQFEIMSLLPGFLLEHVLVNITSDWDQDKERKKKK